MGDGGGEGGGGGGRDTTGKYILVDRVAVECPHLLCWARDQKTFALVREDACIVCAQHVLYIDDAIGGEALLPLAPA